MVLRKLPRPACRLYTTFSKVPTRTAAQCLSNDSIFYRACADVLGRVAYSNLRAADGPQTGSRRVRRIFEAGPGMEDVLAGAGLRPVSTSRRASELWQAKRRT